MNLTILRVAEKIGAKYYPQNRRAVGFVRSLKTVCDGAG
jgi:hypothetical protein